VAQVKQDIDRDIKLEELRKMQQEMKDTAQRYEILAKDTARVADETAAHVEETVTQETAQISKAMQAMSPGDAAPAALERVSEAQAAAALPTQPAVPATPATPAAAASNAAAPAPALDGKPAAEAPGKAA